MKRHGKSDARCFGNILPPWRTVAGWRVACSLICRAFLSVAVSACALDVSFLKTEPAAFTVDPGCHDRWTLTAEHSVALGTGFPTRLRAGTAWQCMGHVATGDVYRTNDQIVTVASTTSSTPMLSISVPGRENAAAVCINPESLLTNSAVRDRNAAISGRLNRPIRSIAPGSASSTGRAMAFSLSPGPATIAGTAPDSGPSTRHRNKAPGAARFSADLHQT